MLAVAHAYMIPRRTDVFSDVILLESFLNAFEFPNRLLTVMIPLCGLGGSIHYSYATAPQQQLDLQSSVYMVQPQCAPTRSFVSVAFQLRSVAFFS
jgi:hypothetical protein